MSGRPRRLAAIKAETKCKALSHNIPLDALAHIEEFSHKTNLQNASNSVKTTPKPEELTDAAEISSLPVGKTSNFIRKTKLKEPAKVKAKEVSASLRSDSKISCKNSEFVFTDVAKRAKLSSTSGEAKFVGLQIPTLPPHDDHPSSTNNNVYVKRTRGRPRKHFLLIPPYFCDRERGILDQIDDDFSADIEEENNWDDEHESSPDRFSPKRKFTRRKTVYTYSRASKSLVDEDKEYSQPPKDLQKMVDYDLILFHNLSLECEEIPSEPQPSDGDDCPDNQDFNLVEVTKLASRPSFKHAISNYINELSLECESIDSTADEQPNPYVECIVELDFSDDCKAVNYPNYDSSDQNFKHEDSSQSNIQTDLQAKKDLGKTSVQTSSAMRTSEKTIDYPKACKYSSSAAISPRLHNDLEDSALKQLLSEKNHSSFSANSNTHQNDPHNRREPRNLLASHGDKKSKNKECLNNDGISSDGLLVQTNLTVNNQVDNNNITPSSMKNVSPVLVVSPKTKREVSKKRKTTNKRFKSSSTNEKTKVISDSKPNEPILTNANATPTETYVEEIDHQSLYNSLAKLKGSSTKKLTPELYLGIKAFPSKWPTSLEKIMTSLNKLDKMLEKESFIDNSLCWMAKKEITSRPVCHKCSKLMSPSMNIVRGQESEYWICPLSCKTIEQIRYPRVVRESRCTSAKFAQILYRWAVRGDFNEMVGTMASNSCISDLALVIKSIQSLCSRALYRERISLSSSENNPVDLVSIQIGDVFIIGAMENSSKSVHLDVFDTTEVAELASKGRNIFVECAKNWISTGSVVRISEKKFNSLEKCGYVLIPFSKSDFNNTNMKARDDNIGGYLIQHLRKLFKDIDLNSIGKELLHLVLSELEWRESFGLEPYQAFLNIVDHLKKELKEEKKA